MPQPDPTQARGRQAAAQARFLRALVAGAPVPRGLAPDRMSQQARVLTRKRRSAVIRSQPALAHVDPADLASMFALYARDHPLRSGACGDHDHAFVQWLSHAGYDMPSAPSRLRRILTGARRARP